MPCCNTLTGVVLQHSILSYGTSAAVLDEWVRCSKLFTHDSMAKVI